MLDMASVDAHVQCKTKRKSVECWTNADTLVEDESEPPVLGSKEIFKLEDRSES